MNTFSRSVMLPGAAPVPIEMYVLDDQIKMMFQGSMWTLIPDISNPIDIELSVKINKPLKPLTSIELELLRLIGRGLADKQIADLLCKSVHTIRHQRDRICQKYGVERKGGLVGLANKLNLV